MIRRQSLAQKIRAVWSGDPALDTEHPGFPEAWRVYEETANPDGLPLKEGQKLTVFDCNPLAHEDWLRTTGVTGRPLANMIIAYTLQRVENYEDAQGRPVDISRDDYEKDGISRHLKREVLAKIYDPFVFDDVAAMVHRHSRLTPPSGQR
jgi:hypothetical protein